MENVDLTFGIETTPADEVPWEENSTRPLALMLDSDHAIDPETIALWVHCHCGLTPVQFIAWLCGELQTLEAIDPYCSK